jgi:hypothetical protein
MCASFWVGEKQASGVSLLDISDQKELKDSCREFRRRATEQKELRQWLSDSPQRRSTECSWSQTDRRSQQSRLTGNKLIQGAASAQLFPVTVICGGCNLRANKSKCQYKSTSHSSCSWNPPLVCNDIKRDPGKRGWGGMGWVCLVQDRDQWRGLVNAVMNLQVPYWEVLKWLHG